jgi:hypothetical protein
MPELDKYRIQSIRGMLERGCLSPVQRRAAIRMLRTKCDIYANGCRKRDRIEEARRYTRLAERYAEYGDPDVPPTVRTK